MNRKLMTKPRARQEAAKALGVAIQTRYRRLLEAEGEDEIVVATADLAQCMYENVEFIIWALKKQGGMSPAPPETLKPISTGAQAPQAPKFEKPPEAVLDPCTCPPLEAGIIGRDRHMTSCPQFAP